MDDVSDADWRDAHADTVYTRSDCSANIVPIVVTGTGKRITVIGCISAKPMVIIPQHTVDLTLLWVSDWNCHICHQSNGFIDCELLSGGSLTYSARKSLKNVSKITSTDPQC
jgi:hypothetical protein